jgi:hypothetical protein
MENKNSTGPGSEKDAAGLMVFALFYVGFLRREII